MMRVAILAGRRLVKRNMQQVIGIDELMNLGTRYDFVRFRVARNRDDLRQALHLDEVTAARVVAGFIVSQVQSADENMLGEFFGVLVQGNGGENVFVRIQHVIGVNGLILFRSINTVDSQALLGADHQEIPAMFRRELSTPADFIALQRGVMIRVESPDVETADLMFVSHGSIGDADEAFRRFSDDFAQYVNIQDFPFVQADVDSFCNGTRLMVEATRRGRFNCITVNRMHFFASYLHFFSLLLQSNAAARYSRAMLMLISFSAFQVLVLMAKMVNQRYVFHVNAAQIWIATCIIKASAVMDGMLAFAENRQAVYADRFRVLLLAMRGLVPEAVRIQYTEIGTLPENADDQTLFVRIVLGFIRETNNVDDCVSSLILTAYSAACFDIIESGFGCISNDRQPIPFALGVAAADGERDRFFCSEELIRVACQFGGSFQDQGFVMADGRVLVGVHN